MKKYNVTVNGESFIVEVEEISSGKAGQAPPAAASAAPAPVVAPATAAAAPAATKRQAGEGDILSPLPGKIIKINCSVGQRVQAGDVVLVIEAMKMENDIVAAADGTVTAIHVAPGASVESGDPLISL